MSADGKYMTHLSLIKESIDFTGDESLVTTFVFLTAAFASLLLALYSDKIGQWRAERKERMKWLRWNRG